MIKALFFDIDRTLVSFNTHEIPASTIEALEAAKAAGVYVTTSVDDNGVSNALRKFGVI